MTASLLVYFFLSSGDFSFLLTYSSFMKCFAFGLLLYKMTSARSAKGVSVKTIESYLLVFVFRLFAISRHQGYLPYDKTGDWFYHLVEIISLLSCIASIYFIFKPLASTYSEKYDKFGSLHIPSEYGIAYLIAPVIVIAMLIHPSLNHNWFTDVCWTISMYMESVAMLPQLYMFQKQANDEGGVVEALTGHTVFALGFSRVFEFFFWLSCFKELMIHGNSYAGYLILFSQLVHLLIMADFFYYYFKSVTKGAPMELPTTYSGVV